MYSDSDGFPIWRRTLLPDPAVSGGVDYLVFPQSGVVASSFFVLETLPVPTQSIQVGTPLNATIHEILTAPSQSVICGTPSNVIVSELMMAPSQSSVFSASGSKKKEEGGGSWLYSPPIYAIRTKGKQTVPAPSQKAFSRFAKKVESVAPIAMQFNTRISQLSPMPSQVIKTKKRRSAKARDDEERFLLMLLNQM